MKICVICHFPIGKDIISYRLSDLSINMASVIELKLDGERSKDDSLCESCFNKVLAHTIKHDDDAVETTQDEGQDESYNKYISFVEKTRMNSTEPAKCVWCLKVEDSTLALPESPERDEIAAIIYPNQISEKNNRICKCCWIKIKNVFLMKSKGEAYTEKNIVTGEEYIILPEYRRCKGTDKHCFVIACENSERRVVPTYLRRVLLENYKFYVPSKARVCSEHIREYYRDWSFLKDLVYNDEFNSEDVEDMMAVLGGVK